MSRGPIDVIVLAGGQSRRMDGEDKLALHVGGAAILARVVNACTQAPTARQIIVAAGRDAEAMALRAAQLRTLPQEARSRVQFTADDPLLDGPVAGLAGAMERVSAPAVVVVAGDMPFLTSKTVDRLAQTLDDADEGEAWCAMAVDADGHRQFACCAWRCDRLRERLAAERSSGNSGRGIPLKALVGPVEARGLLRLVDMGDSTSLIDVDDPEDLQRARALEASLGRG